jgi:prepilin peptidase CpaA
VTGGSVVADAAWSSGLPSAWPLVDTRAVAVVVLGLAATWFDWRTRRLPNALTFGAAAAGCCAGAFGSGLAGLGASAAGWGLGLLLFLPVFALRGMGAGDVKLLAAFGAWLGPAGVWWTAIYGAIAGGLLAIPLLVARGAVIRTLRNLRDLFTFWRVVGPRPHPGLTLDSPDAIRMPYALPIALGAVAAHWWQG